MELLMTFRVTLQTASGAVTRRRPSTARKMRRILLTKEWTKAKIEVVYVKDGAEVGSNVGEYADRDAALLAFEAFNDLDNILPAPLVGFRAKRVEAIAA